MDQCSLSPRTKWLFRSKWNRDRSALLDLTDLTYSYGALDDEIVRRVANLRAAGVTANVRVGLLGMSGIDHALWTLAVLDCAICCPLNPATPLAESLRIVPLMGIDVVLTPCTWDGPVRRTAAELGIPMISYDEDGDLDGRTAASLLNLDTQSDDTRLLLHTSGSTGGVKVVRHTIGTMMAGAVASATTYELTPDDRMSCRSFTFRDSSGLFSPVWYRDPASRSSKYSIPKRYSIR